MWGAFKWLFVSPKKVKLFDHQIKFNKIYCFCGNKLIHDKLSEKYGDYCPNENCSFI